MYIFGLFVIFLSSMHVSGWIRWNQAQGELTIFIIFAEVRWKINWKVIFSLLLFIVSTDTCQEHAQISYIWKSNKDWTNTLPFTAKHPARCKAEKRHKIINFAQCLLNLFLLHSTAAAINLEKRVARKKVLWQSD